jgi:hypothetical protein
LTKDEKAKVRATIFHHLAGIVLAPTLTALYNKGVFKFFQTSSKEMRLDEIAHISNGSIGYLRVAFRLLVSCGWMRQRKDLRGHVLYSLTPEGRVAVSFAPLYAEVASFIPKAIFLEDFLFGKPEETFLLSFASLVMQSKNRWGILGSSDATVEKVQSQVINHLDGMLVGPAMVALARKGIFSQFEQEGSPVHHSKLTGHEKSLSYVFDLLAAQAWVLRRQDSYQMTPEGHYAARIAAAYGVTVSYLPLLRVLGSLLFENLRVSGFRRAGLEHLVNREINVWGCGAAHKNYFKRTDEIIRNIFNRPLDRQPGGICDVGCGDGALLEQLYIVVKNQTIRGQVLEAHPLVLIGVDVSKTARKACSQRLLRAGIPTFHVIPGDIGRPGQLASDLQELSLNIHDLLHVRSFLDHNRAYIPPAHYMPGTRTGKSTAAFVHLGEEIPSDVLEENLVQHLRCWTPYISKFGLLVLELHTLPPEVAAANLDRTPAVAYDAIHGYSDQYPVESEVFLECAREAGLVANEEYQTRFPSSDLTTVSLNLFTVPSDPSGAPLSEYLMEFPRLGVS